jgi:hypothetical protein
VRAWAGPARDLLEPLLTFASADVVRLTYGKLFLLVWLGMLAGLVGLHARHAGRGGRLERWGFRASAVGLALLVIGAFSGFWLELEDSFFALLIIPGLLLLVFGSSIFGLGTWRAGTAHRCLAPRGGRHPRNVADQRDRHARRRPRAGLSRLDRHGVLAVVCDPNTDPPRSVPDSAELSLMTVPTCVVS